MNELLLSYYGDDLTGSTDVMEALASRGVPTVLFTEAPKVEQRARFPDARAVGIAGTSRSETPAWMDAHLAPAFEALRDLGAAVTHYKVCSTFDSAPHIGSIGRAAELGAAAFAQDVVPLVVGAPQLKRYTAFGTLFAAFRGETYRIDRHPVMSRHPVTPMAEADLRRHLAAQTGRPVTLADLAALTGPDPEAAVDRLLATPDSLMLLDVADAATQAETGRQLWRLAQGGRRFTVGSSGVEYALLAEWQRLGLVPGRAEFAAVPRVERLAVVSGSCSPTTEAQIRTALADGFEGLALDPRDLIGPDRDAAVARAVTAGDAILKRGGSVLAYTALGPSTDLGPGVEGERHRIGRGLGRILAGLVAAAGLTRAVVAGGDTSSHALQELATTALTTRMPLAASPGSPLCTAHSDSAAFNGLEIAFKGGQVGDDHYFSRIRDGFGAI